MFRQCILWVSDVNCWLIYENANVRKKKKGYIQNEFFLRRNAFLIFVHDWKKIILKSLNKARLTNLLVHFKYTQVNLNVK